MMQDYISQSTDVLKNKNTVYKNISEFRAVLNNASAHLFKNDVRK